MKGSGALHREESSPDQVAREREVLRQPERVRMIVQRRLVTAPTGRVLACRQRTGNKQQVYRLRER